MLDGTSAVIDTPLLWPAIKRPAADANARLEQMANLDIVHAELRPLAQNGKPRLCAAAIFHTSAMRGRGLCSVDSRDSLVKRRDRFGNRGSYRQRSAEHDT
jgi:hypothetical protein